MSSSLSPATSAGPGPVGRMTAGLGPAGRRLGLSLLLTTLSTLSTGASGGKLSAQDRVQERIDESSQRLEQIRAEQRQLRDQMDRLASQVHDESQAIRLIEGQIGASSSAVAEIDLQLTDVSLRVGLITEDMVRTRDELALRKAVLSERLRRIYKRGPLAAAQVLLGARSFTDLINRYKYLRLVALQDRMVVRQVGDLEETLSTQRGRLATEVERVRFLRGDKLGEIEELERLERQRQRRLNQYRSEETAAQNRLAQLARDEERLRDLLVRLETERREAERLARTTTTPSIRTSDLGNLDWPVDGRVVYSFGPERNGGTTLSRDGIGIAALPGSPVRAIESGRVSFAGPWGLYGPSVIVSHGGGYYSLYLYLQNLAVREDQEITAGQLVGTVGGAETPEGPHIEFQIRQTGSGGEPRPVDPVRWLRDRS